MTRDGILSFRSLIFMMVTQDESRGDETPWSVARIVTYGDVMKDQCAGDPLTVYELYASLSISPTTVINPVPSLIWKGPNSLVFPSKL